MVASLLRWLGPWSDADAVPDGVEQRERVHPRAGDEPLRVALYRPATGRPRGNLLVAHGFSLEGPYNSRFDRLMRILARSGLCVMAPFLRDYQALEFVPRVADDFEHALDCFAHEPWRAPGRRIGLLSISFGSFPVLVTLARHCDREQLSGAVLFGGYGDPRATIRYCIGVLTDAALPPADIRSVPAVAVNLLAEMETSCDRAAVREAWIEIVRRTWGREPLAEPARYARVVESIGETLDTQQRALFRLGAGLQPDGIEVLDAVLSRSLVPERMDPRPLLPAIRHPVHLMHAASDDTIPRSELPVLLRGLPAASSPRSYLTGLYDHTRVKRLSLETLPALGGEARTLLSMLRALASIGATRV